MQHLSKYFNYGELVASGRGAKLGIENIADSRVIANAQLVAAEVLDKVRDQYGAFSPNSWYRSKELNKAVGGASKSIHMTGCAVDIEVSGVDNLDLAEWLKGNTKATKIILEHYIKGNKASGWVHVEFVQGNGLECYTAISRKRARRLGVVPPSKLYGLRRKVWYIKGFHDFGA